MPYEVVAMPDPDTARLSVSPFAITEVTTRRLPVPGSCRREKDSSAMPESNQQPLGQSAEASVLAGDLKQQQGKGSEREMDENQIRRWKIQGRLGGNHDSGV